MVDDEDVDLVIEASELADLLQELVVREGGDGGVDLSLCAPFGSRIRLSRSRTCARSCSRTAASEWSSRFV